MEHGTGGEVSPVVGVQQRHSNVQKTGNDSNGNSNAGTSTTPYHHLHDDAAHSGGGGNGHSSADDEHHTTPEGPSSANSSISSGRAEGCGSESGYRSSDEGTPERARGSHHHHHHHHRHQRHSHHGRREQHRLPRPLLDEEESEGSPAHSTTRQHTEEDGHTTATLDCQCSSLNELNPDGTQKHLFERIYSVKRGQPEGGPGGNGAMAATPAGGAEPARQDAQPDPKEAEQGLGTDRACPAITITISPPPLPRAEAAPGAVASLVEQQQRHCGQLLSSASVGPAEVSSSSSVGGHHLSVTTGRTFMKQSNSRREEHFYELIQPYQEELVRRALGRWYRAMKREKLAADADAKPRRVSSSDSLEEFLAELEEEEASGAVAKVGQHSTCDGEGSSNCPLCQAATPTGSDKGSNCALAAAEQRDNMEATWWREKPRHYKRANIVAYEAQRKAFSSTATSVSGASRVSPIAATAVHLTPGERGESPIPPPPPAPFLQHQRVCSGKASEVPTPFVSAAGTPCSSAGRTIPSPSADVAPSSQAAGDGEMTAPLFELPPDAVYNADKERALRLLAPFVPRFHGIRRVSARELARLTGHTVAATLPTVVVVVPPSTGASVGQEQEQQPQQNKGSSFLATHTASGKCGTAQTLAPTDADNDNAKEGDNSGAEICQMIALEDVCYGFEHPCVLDMKMGQRQYGMHPSPEKKKKKEYRCKISTSGQYGIRLAGFRWWNEREQCYESKGKRACRNFTLAEVKEEMSAFFRGSRALERKFGEQLEELRVTFAQQNILQFFTSSLLFVYDAARPLETCRLVMVDFAFTYERKELAQGGDPGAVFEYDIGYLKALDTLLALLA